jgi:hypothetical protein
MAACLANSGQQVNGGETNPTKTDFPPFAQRSQDLMNPGGFVM